MPAVSIHKPTVVRNGQRTKTAVWWMAWKDPATGKRIRRSTGAREKSVARQIARERERRLALDPYGLSQPVERRVVVWKDFMEEFLTHVASRNRSATEGAYRVSLTLFSKVAKSKFVHEVGVALIQDFVLLRRKEKIAIATVNKDLRAVRASLKWADERDYIHKCPKFKNIFLREDKKAPVVLSLTHRKAIFSALDKKSLKLRVRSSAWWKVFLSLIAELGARRGEALGLTWGAIDLERLEASVDSETSKGRRDRTLPISKPLKKLLIDWQEVQPVKPEENDPVLPWEKKTFRAFYDDWNLIIAAAELPAGIKPVPKNFRSTCGSEMIQAGVPTAVVKDFLGHACITTTESFYVNTGNSLRAAAEKRNNLLEG